MDPAHRYHRAPQKGKEGLGPDAAGSPRTRKRVRLELELMLPLLLLLLLAVILLWLEVPLVLLLHCCCSCSCRCRCCVSRGCCRCCSGGGAGCNNRCHSAEVVGCGIDCGDGCGVGCCCWVLGVAVRRCGGRDLLEAATSRAAGPQ